MGRLGAFIAIFVLSQVGAAQAAFVRGPWLQHVTQTSARLVWEALTAPARNIAENAGLEGSVMVRAIEAETGSMGLNAATGEIVDLVKAGIIDPAKVTRAGLQNASSIAALLLTTECLVADQPEPSGGGMGGMDPMGGMGGMM